MDMDTNMIARGPTLRRECEISRKKTYYIPKHIKTIVSSIYHLIKAISKLEDLRKHFIIHDSIITIINHLD